jgi:hypothetical protein
LVSRSSSYVALACVLLIWWPAGLAAGPPPNATPEEMRRGREIHERLATLRRENATIARSLDRAGRRLVLATSDAVRASLHGEIAALNARREVIADERTVLETELAALPPDARAAPRPQPPGARTPLDPTGLQPVDVLGGTGQAADARAFNPGIAVIPDIAYFRDDRRGESLAFVEQADGFHGVHADDDHGHAHGTLDEGFNLRETELAFTASVDPYFDAVALLAVSEEGVEAEEIYAQTRRLPGGLQVRAGKFLSGIGYANRQHPHQWDFVDQNLAYELLLGGHGLAETGMQVTWLPRVPLFLHVGGELFQGENEKFAHYIGPETFPGVTAGAPERTLSHQAGPRLFTVFVKLAPDLGYAHALQAGGAVAFRPKHQEIHDHDGAGIPDDVLDGTATLWGGDVVYRYDSPRQYGAGDLTVQAEYLRRTRRLDVLGAPLTTVFRNDGFYVQGVYGVAPRWQAAARASVAGWVNERVHGSSRVTSEASTLYSAALTFNPTEFSRLRVQYNRGRVWADGEPGRFHQVFVQLQLSLGVHGAHTF